MKILRLLHSLLKSFQQWTAIVLPIPLRSSFFQIEPPSVPPQLMWVIRSTELCLTYDFFRTSVSEMKRRRAG